MNTTSEDRMKVNLAALEGDINRLYSVIQENPHVLEDIDSIPFVDTPLHVAASAGHVPFAIEIMRLKPSFGWKLNPQGFTPIHLALQYNHSKMVLRLVDINKDLIRVEGREGLTPLHLVSLVGDIDLLVEFLQYCPKSIKDVTIKKETALHISVRHGQYEALQVLIGWLIRTSKIGPETERAILNFKDEDGNTILHVSSCQNNLQMVKLMVTLNLINLNAKNIEGRLAIDLATNEEMRSILVKAGADSSVTDRPALADTLKLNTTVWDALVTVLRRILADITEDQRSAYLIIATLVITTTYDSALSPPGGVYQANVEDNNTNATCLNSTTSILNSTATILNSTATATLGKHAGKAVMSEILFVYVSFFNFLCFFASAVTIFFLMAPGLLGFIVNNLIVWLFFSYFFSIMVISPTIALPIFYLIFSLTSPVASYWILKAINLVIMRLMPCI